MQPMTAKTRLDPWAARIRWTYTHTVSFDGPLALSAAPSTSRRYHVMALPAM
jgi:hypothetical protein